MKRLVFAFVMAIALQNLSLAQERLDLYHTMDEVYEKIASYLEVAPEIVFLDTLGYSQQFGYPIIGLKITDNPELDEDEPCVLYDGLHHAREPISMEICLLLIEELIGNYGIDPQITGWIDETEIWIIPMMNPEGWKYLVDNKLEYPFWRKNLRDNNENGAIDHNVDGVDLNRNYDFNWIYGGSSDFGSMTYRGPEAFSEGEARAKRNLALREKPVLSLSYHSYGEIIIYSWSDRPEAPDQELMVDIASGLANTIPKSVGPNTYQPSVSNCQNGFSRCWMYAVVGSLEFTVETAREFVPYGQQGLRIAEDNMDGTKYLLDRVHRSGLQIYVKDAQTLEPLVAQISMDREIDSPLHPRYTDSLYGRHDKMLLPGTHSIEVRAEGYQSQRVENLVVTETDKTLVTVLLEPVSTGIQTQLAIHGNQIRGFQCYPNPMESELNIAFELERYQKLSIRLLNLAGQEVKAIFEGELPIGAHRHTINRASERHLKPGLYFLELQGGADRLTQRILITH